MRARSGPHQESPPLVAMRAGPIRCVVPPAQRRPSPNVVPLCRLDPASSCACTPNPGKPDVRVRCSTERNRSSAVRLADPDAARFAARLKPFFKNFQFAITEHGCKGFAVLKDGEMLKTGHRVRSSIWIKCISIFDDDAC